MRIELIGVRHPVATPAGGLLIGLCFAGGMALGLLAHSALLRPTPPPPAHTEEEKLHSSDPLGIEASGLEPAAFAAGRPA